MIVFGLIVSLIGMGTVLFALVLLMGIIKALGHLAALAGEAAPPEERKRKRILRKPAVAPPETVAAKDQDEVIAVVIAAALAACVRDS